MIEVMEHYFAVRPDDLIFNQSDLDAMPEGTVVWHEYEAWTKGANDLWQQQNRPSRPGVQIVPNREGFTSLRSYPEGFEYTPETLAQWQWKLRDVTLAAAKRHSVQGVPEALERLKVTAEVFPVGAGMRITDRQTRDDLTILPVGSVVANGSINSPLFSLYRRTPQMWLQFFGPSNATLGAVCTVVEVGGIEFHRAWLDEAGDQSSVAQIRSFKGKVWTEGVRAQSRHGWCGVFNQVLDLLGVNEQAGRLAAAEAQARYTPGTTLTATEAGDTPVGTLFSHRAPEDTIYWYQRTNGSTRNRAQTHRILSVSRPRWQLFSGSGHFANQMTLLGYPNDWIDVGAVDPDYRIHQYHALPHGVRFRFSNDPETYYIKINNMRVRVNGVRTPVEDLLRENSSSLQVQITENWNSSC